MLTTKPSTSLVPRVSTARPILAIGLLQTHDAADETHDVMLSQFLTTKLTAAATKSATNDRPPVNGASIIAAATNTILPAVVLHNHDTADVTHDPIDASADETHDAIDETNAFTLSQFLIRYTTPCASSLNPNVKYAAIILPAVFDQKNLAVSFMPFHAFASRALTPESLTSFFDCSQSGLSQIPIWLALYFNPYHSMPLRPASPSSFFTKRDSFSSFVSK